MLKTYQLGAIGEAKAMAALVDLGIEVYIPIDRSSKIDMIGLYNDKTYRIQVKTSEHSYKNEGNKIRFVLTSSTIQSNGKYKKTKYTKKDIDLFLLYNYEKDCIYILEPNDEGYDSITIKYEDSKSRQIKNVNNEEDFLLKNVFKKYFK